MIDLHCHILPRLDDGAVDLADSLAMARQAEADGIELVCATPHIRHDHDVLAHELEHRAGELNEALAGEGLSVRVTPGGEVAETIVDELDDDELAQVSLGEGRGWVLLEPAPGPLGPGLLDVVDRLRERGYRTVVAHPERHPADDFGARLAALTERGALIQVTAALIAAGPAAPTMLDLAAEGLVHLVGSDAHSARAGRPVVLSHALERLRAVERLEPHLSWIALAGPAAILRGEPVVAPFAPA